MRAPAVANPVVPAKAWRRSWRRLEVLPYLLPGLVLFAIFVLWPLLQGVRISFYQWNIMPGAEQQWLGLANYLKAFHDPVVGVALRNTLLYAVVTVPGQMMLGLLVALVLNQKIPGRSLWRALYYLPVITSWVICSYLFVFLFGGGQSPVNYLFHDLLHWLPSDVEWLQNGWTAQVAILALGVWKGVGWNMVMFLAGLQNIPPELYEAAAIDGAGGWQRFWHITLPLLRFVLLYLAVVLTIGAFGVMLPHLLMTGGGPLNSTQTMLLYMYTQGFKFFDFGYGFALALLSGMVLGAISFLQFRFLRRDIES